MSKLILTVLVATAAVGCGNGLSLSPRTEPEGTTYTILLRTFTGPDHVSQSKRWKDQTVGDAGWDDVFVVHKDEHSALHRGRYRTIDAAQDDLRESKEYNPGSGIRPYAQAIIIPLPGEQVGPPEWHLSNIEGEWTVKVAIFYDMPDQNYVGRKSFAVDYCERLRKAGYEAFYAHDPAESHVYIGDFPASAITVTQGDGRQSLSIRDPRVRQILEDFPQLAVNGSGERIRTYDPQAQKVQYVDRKSHPVRVGARNEQQERTGL